MQSPVIIDSRNEYHGLVFRRGVEWTVGHDAMEALHRHKATGEIRYTGLGLRLSVFLEVSGKSLKFTCWRWWGGAMIQDAVGGL